MTLASKAALSYAKDELGGVPSRERLSRHLITNDSPSRRRWHALDKSVGGAEPPSARSFFWMFGALKMAFFSPIISGSPVAPRSTVFICIPATAFSSTRASRLTKKDIRARVPRKREKPGGKSTID